MKLEEIYKELNSFIEKEEAIQTKWPQDSEYNVPTWNDIYDALEIIDSIINYEPSDAELEAYNDYVDPPHVVNQRMLEMKRESHGRKFL